MIIFFLGRNDNMANISYSIECKVLMDKKEPIILDNMINKFEIINEYDNAVFPMIRLYTKLDFDSYYDIQSSSNVKFSLTIKKYEQRLLANNSRTVYSYFIKNKIFTPIDRNKNLINKPESSNDNISNEELPILSNSFILIGEDELKNNKKLINTVGSETDMYSMISYISKYFSDRDLIIEYPENNKIYDQIIIPPLNPILAIKYLNEVYGIYSSGIRVFFDINRYYITNKHLIKDKEILKEYSENVFINIFSDDNDSSELIEVERDQDGTFNVNSHISSLRVISYEDSRKEFLGTENLIISQSDNKLNKNFYGDDKYRTKVYYHKYQNELKEKELTNKLNEDFYIVLTVDGLDINSINPINNFLLKFYNDNYKEYDGNYSLMKAVSSLNFGSNGQGGVQMNLYLKRKA
ncbi:hypothetical protein Bp8pS_274 [Bacillus phage vB_BpuM-BpSp]|nr:hypothetical protein Bp8pS_274 [Bacillus phage vB_BpuM-BpSp]